MFPNSINLSVLDALSAGCYTVATPKHFCSIERSSTDDEARKQAQRERLKTPANDSAIVPLDTS